MDTETFNITTYDESGEVTVEEVVSPLPREIAERRQAVAAYKAEKSRADVGNLSMVRLRERIDALENLLSLIYPELKDGD